MNKLLLFLTFLKSPYDTIQTNVNSPKENDTFMLFSENYESQWRTDNIKIRQEFENAHYSDKKNQLLAYDLADYANENLKINSDYFLSTPNLMENGYERTSFSINSKLISLQFSALVRENKLKSIFFVDISALLKLNTKQRKKKIKKLIREHEYNDRKNILYRFFLIDLGSSIPTHKNYLDIENEITDIINKEDYMKKEEKEEEKKGKIKIDCSFFFDND